MLRMLLRTCDLDMLRLGLVREGLRAKDLIDEMIGLPVTESEEALEDLPFNELLLLSRKLLAWVGGENTTSFGSLLELPIGTGLEVLGGGVSAPDGNVRGDDDGTGTGRVVLGGGVEAK